MTEHYSDDTEQIAKATILKNKARNKNCLSTNISACGHNRKTWQGNPIRTYARFAVTNQKTSQSRQFLVKDLP